MKRNPPSTMSATNKSTISQRNIVGTSECVTGDVHNACLLHISISEGIRALHIKQWSLIQRDIRTYDDMNYKKQKKILSCFGCSYKETMKNKISRSLTWQFLAEPGFQLLCTGNQFNQNYLCFFWRAYLCKQIIELGKHFNSCSS